MSWDGLLGPLQRLPGAALLDDWHARVQQHPGDAAPFARALLGGGWPRLRGWRFSRVTSRRCGRCGRKRRRGSVRSVQRRIADCVRPT